MPGNSTNTTSNTTASDVAGGAAGPPAGSPGAGIAEQAREGILNGLDVARQMAGDIVRSVVPESVLDSIPFLAIDVLGGVL